MFPFDFLWTTYARTNVAEAFTRIVGERQRDTEKRSAILGALMVSGDQTDRGFHSPLLVDVCETTIMTLAFTFLTENRLALAQLKVRTMHMLHSTTRSFHPNTATPFGPICCQVCVISKQQIHLVQYECGIRSSILTPKQKFLRYMDNRHQQDIHSQLVKIIPIHR
ncbi:Cytochrome P450 90A1 [Senna tora]|uniref:Cytochrome P450 90A1 n=1 Tax=Senna tora TaxID=362788 RepID=A0A834WU47_9FABA|nr:Cytochrome P450 90A1 [Senna tora]